MDKTTQISKAHSSMIKLNAVALFQTVHHTGEQLTPLKQSSPTAMRLKITGPVVNAAKSFINLQVVFCRQIHGFLVLFTALIHIRT